MPATDPTAEILARLDAIALQLATLTAAVKGKRAAASDDPHRLTTVQACARLGIGRKKLGRQVARGLLTQIRPGGRRQRGSPVYYDPKEVEVLAFSEEAARELQSQKKQRGR